MRDVEIWIDALRTAKKGQLFLKDETGAMCCLGVAAELAGIVGVWGMSSLDKPCFLFEGSPCAVPKSLIEHFEGSLGQHREKGADKGLSRLNDHSDTFHPVIKALTEEPENYVRLNGVPMFPDAEKRAG
jgi:hypothetical protein